MALVLIGCAHSSVYVTKADCSDLVPKEWRNGVASAPAPSGGAQSPSQDENEAMVETLKRWINFGLAQTGNLVTANSRTDDAIGIIERCEQRDREAIEAAKPKFLGLF